MTELLSYRDGEKVDEANMEWWKNVTEVAKDMPHLNRLSFARPFSYVSENITPEKLIDDDYFLVHSAKSTVVATSYAHADRHGASFQLEKCKANPTGVSRYTVKISSLEALQKAVSISKNEIGELRTILAKDHGLVHHICGFSSQVKHTAEAIKELSADGKDATTREWTRWIHLVNFMESKSSSEENSTSAKNANLSVQDVERELHIIAAMAGWSGLSYPLKAINWVTDYVFTHGNRSPPWRQQASELGYIELRLHDREKLIVTACTTGYFVTKGFVKDSNGLEVFLYDKQDQSEMVPSLLHLLRVQSPHFNSTFEKRTEIINAEFPLPSTGPEAVAAPPLKSDKTARQPSQPAKNVGTPTAKKVALAVAIEVESHEDSDEEEELNGKRTDNYEPTAEYWQIQKLTKYLRIGNQTATIVASCALRDCDLHISANQLAIRDLGTLEILVNLLESGDARCIQGSLTILSEISQNEYIRSSLCELDSIMSLISHLADVDSSVQCLAAKVLANCGKSGRNRELIRKYDGIQRLVHLLKSSNEDVVRCAALALCSCSKSSKTKALMDQYNALPLLARLLESKNDDLLVPVVGTLFECALDSKYRTTIRNLGMLEKFVEILQRSKHAELQTHCANAIFKCAQDEASRNIIQSVDGLQPLVNLLDANSGRELLSAVTGALWNCSESVKNVEQLIKMGGIKKLITLMENQVDEVLINIVGALGACAQTAEGRTAIREGNGISPVLQLLKRTDTNLLVNVTKTVGLCAQDSDCMALIDKMDGVRLLWSLLKSPNTAVQASAAWAISPCIENAKDAGEMVRSFVGGLELVVSLLRSDHADVLASVCAAIAKISKDEENLAVLTDHGVVQMLAKLCQTKDDKLRASLAEAVANACPWGGNRAAFGVAKAVGPLARFLKSSDQRVHRATAAALFQLSANQSNCVQMHEHDVVPLLLDLIGTGDEAQQEAAAGTLANIRKLALASDKATFG